MDSTFSDSDNNNGVVQKVTGLFTGKYAPLLIIIGLVVLILIVGWNNKKEGFVFNDDKRFCLCSQGCCKDGACVEINQNTGAHEGYRQCNPPRIPQYTVEYEPMHYPGEIDKGKYYVAGSR